MTVLPTVRGQILEAARREASRQPARRFIAWPRWRRRSGHVGRRLAAVWPLVLALSIAVTVTIAIAALVLLRHPGQGQSSASQTRALIARLAVLRRPQQPFDMLPACCHPQSTLDGAIIPRFSRLVATVPGARFYLVVTKPAAGPMPLWSPELGSQVAIVEIARGNVSETPGVPAADLSDPSQVTLLGNGPRADRSRKHLYVVEIVPDGVARVRWDFRDPRGGPDHLVSRRASHNLVVMPAGHQVDPLLLRHVTWYRSDGSLAPTSFSALRRARAAQDAPRRARELQYDLQHSFPAPKGLLAHFSIFKINSPTGIPVAPGIVILHPRLSSAPLFILDVSTDWPWVRLDPLQTREVITPSVTLVVVPGRRGICIADIRKSPLTGIPDGGGSSCNDQGVAKAEAHGVGAGSWNFGVSTTFGIVPDSTKTVTLRIGPHRTRVVRPLYGVYIYSAKRRPGHEPTIVRSR
jgi:hypothetical protein